jgi:tRNA(His) 5'-end guanylyltransferase
MPYETDDEVPSYVAAHKRAQWREVWNSVYFRLLAEGLSPKQAEQLAFIQANGVVRKST